jgi:hypothetical protein
MKTPGNFESFVWIGNTDTNVTTLKNCAVIVIGAACLNREARIGGISSRIPHNRKTHTGSVNDTPSGIKPINT